MDKCNKQYTTYRIAPSLRESVLELVSKLKAKNRRWSESRLVNIALLEWLPDFRKLNDSEIDRLFCLYDSTLKAGHGKLK